MEMENEINFRREPHRNDKNVLSCVSNEDNTQFSNETSTNDQTSITRKHGPLKRQNSFSFLSIAEAELENVKRQIERNIQLQESRRTNNSIKNCPNSPKYESKLNYTDDSSISSETLPKEFQNHEHEVYARHIQEGDTNMMLICQPKGSTSTVYCKQVGNKNIMVNLNISSSTCQLMDCTNRCILKLDTDGEVWLEIKRISKKVFERESHCRIKHDQWNNLNKANDPGSGCNNINDETQLDTKNINISCSSNETGQWCNGYPRRPYSSENEDKTFSSKLEGEENTCYNESICVNEDEGRHLSLKFKKQNSHHLECLNCENIHDSFIMQHKKVVDFLMNAGNNFDVSIYDWEYDQKSRYEYSYIVTIADNDRGSDGYDVPRNWRAFTPPSDRPREPEENKSDGSSTYTESINSAVKAECKVPEYDTVKEINGYKMLSRDVRALPLQNHKQLIKTGIHRFKEPKISQTAPVPPIRKHTTDKTTKEQDTHVQINNVKDQSTEYKAPTVPPRTWTQSSTESEKKVVPDNLNGNKWYHGSITQDQAQARLKGKKPGSFLVRDSFDKKEGHQFTIEFVDQDKTIKKLSIIKTNDKFHFKDFKDKRFDQVKMLIETILKSGLEIKNSCGVEWNTLMMTPVNI